MSNEQGNVTAFPLYDTDAAGNITFRDTGMSIRDYFAAQALSGLLCRSGYDPSGAAEDAYKMADAMIAEREK